MPDTELADAFVDGLGAENGGATELHVVNGSAVKHQPVVPVTFKQVKPHLVIQAPKAAEALAFYKKAFGAEELQVTHYPKRKAEQEQPLIMHAHIRFGASEVYLADETEEMTGSTVKSPAALKGTSLYLHLETNDVDAAVARAVAAGGAVGMEVADQPWGDRYGTVVDPFGYVWSLSTPVSKEVAGLADIPIEAGQAA